MVNENHFVLCLHPFWRARGQFIITVDFSKIMIWCIHNVVKVVLCTPAACLRRIYVTFLRIRKVGPEKKLVSMHSMILQFFSFENGCCTPVCCFKQHR